MSRVGTLDKYHFSSEYEFHQVKTGCFDTYPNFHGIATIILGVIIVLFGLMSIALGIGSICTHTAGYYIGYGIWIGFIFCLTGVICIIAAVKKSVCMIVTTLVFCVLTICCASVQISLGIVGANSDSPTTDDKSNYNPDMNFAYDLYHSAHFDLKMCSGRSVFNWAQAWGPVNILLLLVGFIELFTTFVVSVLVCMSTCNGSRRVKEYGFAVPVGTGYANEGYMTQDVRVASPLYKVTM